MQYITPVDYILLLFYLFFLYYIIKLKAIKYKDTSLYRYFIIGFLVHMTGTILYAMVVQYYYGYGDSFGFYQGGQVIRKSLETGNPFSTFFLNGDESAKLYKLSGGDNPYMEAGLGNSASLVIYKLTAVLSYISFNSYLIISLFFGLFSFAGVWRLFCVLNEMQQRHFEKWFAYGILFLPSICFWGSGLTKDSLCLGLVGFIFSTGYYFFAKKEYKIRHIIIMVASVYLLFMVKGYIASALIVSALLTYIINIILKSKGNIIKLAFVLFILISGTIFLSFSVSSTLESVIDESKEQIETFKNSYENMGDADDANMANFKESDFDFTIGGIILRAPQKIASTLYRPFIWETKKPIMLLSVLESLLMFVTFVFVLYKSKVGHFLYCIFANPEIFFAFTFVLLMAAIVGFTTFNFGTLVRYRLPLLPFYFFMLLAIYGKRKQKEAQLNLQ